MVIPPETTILDNLADWDPYSDSDTSTGRDSLASDNNDLFWLPKDFAVEDGLNTMSPEVLQLLSPALPDQSNDLPKIGPDPVQSHNVDSTLYVMPDWCA